MRDLRSSWSSGRLPDLIGLLARLILGVALFWAGALKVTRPDQSALAVRAYKLLNYDFAGYVGYGLPIIEILVGVLLAVGLLTRPSAAVGHVGVVEHGHGGKQGLYFCGTG